MSSRSVVALALLVSVLAVPVSAQVIDHTSVAAFDAITPEQQQQAAALRFTFSDRSVGDNVNQGLNCLSYFPMSTAPNSCKTGSPEVWSRAYPRTNWVYSFVQPSNGLWTGYQPWFFTAINPADWDVLTFQFDYLTGSWPDSVANYLTVRSGNHDVYDFEAWATTIAPKRAIYQTTSLPAADDGSGMLGRLHAFNVAMRAFIAARPGTILIDFADIESDGGVCVSPSGLPVICSYYTNDSGHPNAFGKVRLAKAYWVALVAASGPEPPDPCDTFPLVVQWSGDLTQTSATDNRGCAAVRP